jgi:histidyl-tRNA synthetase
MFQRVKGTQDFLDLRIFNFILDQASKHLKLYHFTPIATPILEPTELFKRSLGLETDVVSKEMYTVNTGHEGESICLRPEATASTVRAFIENNIQQLPWKVFSWGPMFRHERPQKGRFRQFHQVNIEVIGSAAIAQDVELISLLDRLFSQVLAFDSYALAINFLGCHEDRVAFKNTLHAYLETVADKICENCKVRKESNILRVFDCKIETCQKLYENAPQLLSNLCLPCKTEWQQLQDQLEMLSVAFTIKPTLVRGLDYYNKTVFEFMSSNLGAQNAFCGGGRYDQLVAQLGGREDQPSVGAAIGIERLLMLLEPIKDRLQLPELPALHVIIPMAVEQQTLALLLTQELVQQNLCVDVLLDGGSMKSMMRQANKMGAQFCLILGADEQEKKEVTVKNMVTGQETRVKQIEVAGFLKR